ncbi:MAG TPA: M20 family metallopeptidase [Euzebyales bacterium]|nr:M20 family metallopeptidase [Euzebyales bacterium]
MNSLGALRERTSAMVDELRLLVEHESPTGDVERLDALADTLVEQWERTGATTTRHRVDGVGTHLELVWPGPRGTPDDAAPVLFVGHYDTVHDVGTLERNPWRVDDDGRAWGPGTQDMKSGLVIARHALAHLLAAGQPVQRPVVALLTADEEVGSPSSSALIRERAGSSAMALVFEASTSSGALKTARKGVGLWTVTAHGRAAHAGQHFFDGRNANVGLARVLPAIAQLSDEARGTTVNVGTVRGGTRANVVAARAEAVIDVRFTAPEEARRVAAGLAALTTYDGVTLEVDGGVNRPAMQRTDATAALFVHARACARRLGLELEEAAAGGASDGNLTADEGTPTLDGLGGVGEGLHTDDEWVRVDSLPCRAALLAELLSRPAEPTAERRDTTGIPR